MPLPEQYERLDFEIGGEPYRWVLGDERDCVAERARAVSPAERRRMQLGIEKEPRREGHDVRLRRDTRQVDTPHKLEVVFVRLPLGVFAALAPCGDLGLDILDARHRVGLAELLRRPLVVEIDAVDGTVERAHYLEAELPQVGAGRGRQIDAGELLPAIARRGAGYHVGEVCADIADANNYAGVGELQLLPVLGGVELAADAGGEGRDGQLEIAAHVGRAVAVDLHEAVKLRHRRGLEPVDDLGFRKSRKQYGCNQSQGLYYTKKGAANAPRLFQRTAGNSRFAAPHRL